MKPVVALILAAPALLGGCRAVPEIAGVIAGAVAGGASANPAVGFAVGVAVDAAADIGIRYFGRTRQRAEQDAIAAVAGGLAPLGTAAWRVDHDIPIGNEHGMVRLVEAIETPLAQCRRILFSVEEAAAGSRWYAADVCRQAGGWKWAGAEPAVERWGNLQ